ncbi:MAG UNVERIFIED_CONTAM: ABC transporter ATP-binding protein [Planctomycetaceae bacterium]|jgi:ABC-type sugar transport system ATPase subunit
MIELDNVTLTAGSCRLEGLSLQIPSGQYAVLMGRTGIGKTTILEAICGLRAVESGRIRIQQVDVTDWDPADRRTAYMPQDLALFPTMTVRQHLEFALRIRRRPRAEMARRVDELAALLQLESILERPMRGLSGGEAQRTALGRALAWQPAALLLDEPVSALDAATRQSALALLKSINRTTNVTVLHVTHNEDEAAVLADLRLQLVADATTGRRVLGVC